MVIGARRRDPSGRHAALGELRALGHRLVLHLVLPRHPGVRADHPLGQLRRLLSEPLRGAAVHRRRLRLDGQRSARGAHHRAGHPRPRSERGGLRRRAGASRHHLGREGPDRGGAVARHVARAHHAPDRPAAGDARDHPADGQRDHLHAQDHLAGRRHRRSTSCSADCSRSTRRTSRSSRCSSWPASGTSSSRRCSPSDSTTSRRTSARASGEKEAEAAEKRAAKASSEGAACLTRVDISSRCTARSSRPANRWSRPSRSGSRFGKLDVLKGIDLEVMPQETFVLLGPSGGGKSTLLRCINHLEKIDAGRLWVDGELMGYRQKGDVLHEMKARDVARQRAKIGMVFQRFNLFPHMTAIENVMEAPIKVQHVPRKQAETEAEKLLTRGRPQGEARRLPGSALGRPAAARGHRPCPGHEAQADALRRAHLGARPRAGRRGARRDEAARPSTA